MKNYSVRTDLALEEKERFASDNVEVQGVVLEEEYDEENEIRLTRVVIETETVSYTHLDVYKRQGSYHLPHFPFETMSFHVSHYVITFSVFSQPFQI